jgi:hypothetical protein
LTGKDLKSYIENTLKTVNEYVKHNNFRISMDPESLVVDLDKIRNFSHTCDKHVNARLRQLNRKQSIRRINTTMHWLFKHILGEAKYPVVKISEKEELIQKKRKEWKEARDKAEELLKEYKKEKGNFYK